MVSVAPCADYSDAACERALRDALSAALDWVTPGMKIAVKVNLITMMKPAAAATTHPALLCALVKLLAERGATAVVGDSPGGPFTGVYVNRVYAATGMRQVEALGGHVNADFSTRNAQNPRGKKLKDFPYTAWLGECDAIINFSKLKTHGMMGMTAAVKNMFGAIPGTVKPQLHYVYPNTRDFADMLVDLNEFFKPRLNIVDAVIGMEGNGPSMGTPRAIGCVLAGANPYEVDEVCARIIGIGPEAAPTLSAARDRALFSPDFAIRGDVTPFLQSDFLLAPRHDVKFLSGVFGSALTSALQPRPTLVPAACVGCEKCREVCPAGAITMKNRRPVIHRKSCIRCFCCQELCPKGALLSRKPPLSRLLGG